MKALILRNLHESRLPRSFMAGQSWFTKGMRRLGRHAAIRTTEEERLDAQMIRQKSLASKGSELLGLPLTP